MNSVALAFVLDLDEFTYSVLVSDEEQREMGTVTPLVFQSSFPLKGPKSKFFKKANWALTIVPLICVVVTLRHNTFHTKPIVETLDCACFQRGPHCTDASFFSPNWWHAYWAGTAAM